MVRRRGTLMRRRTMSSRFLILSVVAVSLTKTKYGSTTASDAGATGWWMGSYTLAGPGTLTVRIEDGRGTVALGLGHPGVQVVPVASDGQHVRFALPGRPAPVSFDGIVDGNRLTGTVRQGTLRGTFRARRGEDRSLIAVGS